jgi:hypothetical protein
MRDDKKGDAISWTEEKAVSSFGKSEDTEEHRYEKYWMTVEFHKFDPDEAACKELEAFLHEVFFWIESMDLSCSEETFAYARGFIGVLEPYEERAGVYKRIKERFPDLNVISKWLHLGPGRFDYYY